MDITTEDFGSTGARPFEDAALLLASMNNVGEGHLETGEFQSKLYRWLTGADEKVTIVHLSQ
ncbi:hypothetical protein M427DRAFT_137239 [Gonapodya prolifera JEL478]|uniref:Uncharacterized protein n=1 Tax=Gonapodya prolifera (strain JEL478) TaxID=1344416 RepID=A0A139A6U0_GONPJ|nr:hypothetical protein M427DRAFT_137239 [Gonapodya prolifera JEL478]|eukprot:KXS12536.1 hypothetical protein M427DRAFT_137239 [Gonapodya prolifera JEL478]